MFKHRSWRLILFALGLVALAACAPTSTPTVAPVAPPTAIAPATTATRAAYPLSVTDSNARAVTIGKQPQKFVSLSPSVTEILYALGLGGNVIAVDQFSDYPSEAKSVLNIGGSRGAFNFEKIVELNPDVVFGAGPTSPETIKKLEDLKMTVAIIGSRNSSIESIMSDILLTGQITGVPAKARQVAADMQKKLDGLKTKLALAKSQPKVYWEIDATNPSKPYTVGPGNFVHDIITLAGGANIFANAASPFPQVGAEQIVAADPAVIILVSNVSPESVKARSGWDGINAVKNNKIFIVDANLTSRTGPRVVDGLEAAMQLIHPELFQ